MADNDYRSLTPLPDGALGMTSAGTERILSQMINETLALTRQEHSTQRVFPREKLELANQLAESLLDEGIKTPEALAKWLDSNYGEKARPFSQALWNQLSSVDPSLTGQHDWEGIYGRPAPAALTETQGNAKEREPQTGV